MIKVFAIFVLIFTTNTVFAEIPQAEIKQTYYCSGIVAETKPSATRGFYIIGTTLYVETGPVGAIEWFDFLDMDNYGSSNYLEPQYISSSAGCENCMPEYASFHKNATSEHFWQQHGYQNFKDYCPHADTFGVWNGIDYCESISRTHLGCIKM